MKLSARAGVVFVGVLAGLAACAPEEDGDQGDPGDQSFLSSNDPLEQGWSDDQVTHFERTADGSALFPYKWLVALEQEKSKDMFLADENVRKYGFIPSPNNPDGLPVGLAKQRNANDDDVMVGSTCSSCHEAELSYKGTTFRVHGGQGAADISALTLAAYDALDATLNNPLKFRRFAKRVEGSGFKLSKVGEYLQAFKKLATLRVKLLVQQVKLRGSDPLENGPFRADAFGIGINRLVGPIKSGNLRPTKSSASMQHLWNTHLIEWAQYNGSAAQPMARNVISALGRGATISFETEEGKPGLANSVDLENLYSIETNLAKLRAPKWPEKLFGKIDRAAAMRGRAIYAAPRDGASCGTCHNATKNERGYYDMKMVPLAEIGTDPENAKTLDRTVDMNGKLGMGEIPISEFLYVSTQGVLDRGYFDLGTSRADIEKMNGNRENRYRAPAGYRPRSLDGIWATAPLLHNGSVPNLYQLLLPEAKRVQKFRVGSHEMDPKNVGLVTEGEFELDTTLQGNRNTGHSGAKFGTELSDAERWDLIEYLKTL